ncbi:MAG: spore maturation protein [Bacteroidetes bacterium]|nr:spore maturation protein [Bacteroidota bacterium]
MALNYIWIAFFLIAFVVGLIKLLFFGDTEIFKLLVDSTFDSSKTAFEISIGLTGIMALWLGLMNIGEKAGAINFFSRLVNPLFSRLFPGIPKEHPAIGQIVMNFSANMLGLGNAATPLGLKAMQSMQDLNTDKESATDPQIMFLVLNTAGFTLLPVTIMMFRAQLGAADPSDVFIPILLASFFATIGGVTAVAIKQRINIFDPVLLAWGLSISAIITGIVFYFRSLSHEQLATVSKLVSNFILFGIMIAFITAALLKKVNVFDAFIEGAKSGFETAIKIIPYMVAMLVAIAVFRASGAMDYLIDGLVFLTAIPPEVADALPTAFMKPLSGSGARGMMIDAMNAHGVDSFTGRLASTIQGSADTTFYIIALYFGSVGIKKARYAVGYGLLADLFGFIAAILVAYLFFR